MREHSLSDQEIQRCSSHAIEKGTHRLNKLMRKFKIRKISSLVFVLVALAGGCGREQAPNPAFPRVIATFPANGATDVVTNTTVSAGFSSVMNPSTINTTTFTLTGPGATPVAGAVSYTGTTAILTPTVRLAANTPYIANVTTAETRSPLKVLQPHESEGDHQYNLGTKSPHSRTVSRNATM